MASNKLVVEQSPEMEETGPSMKWELWDLSHQETVRSAFHLQADHGEFMPVHYPGNQVCVCIQRWLQSLSDFPNATSEPVCIHSCLLLISGNKNPFVSQYSEVWPLWSKL